MRPVARLILLASVAFGLGSGAASAADPLAQVAKLLASDGEEYDLLGGSIAMSGDTVVVGAPNVTVNSSKYGAAYVFVKTGADWTSMVEVARLTQATNLEGEFGGSVAIDGDTIVVGAVVPYTLGQPSHAYVFVRPPGGWVDATETAKLSASDPSEHFGYSVAIDGDTVVVGAPFGTADGDDNGAVFIYEKPVGGWVDATTEDAKLTASAPILNDRVGWSVALDGDTLVAGAAQYSDSPVAGRALVFERPLGGWASGNEAAVLTASDEVGGYGYFGNSVDVSGDTVVVGSPLHEVSGDVVGAVYVYVRPLSGWTSATETAQLLPPGLPAGAGFGWSTALSGDRLVTGAYALDNEDGAVFVFDEPVGGWISGTSETAILRSSDPAQSLGSLFGNRLGVAVDIDGGTIVAGAPTNDMRKGVNAGSAYVFEEVANAITCPTTPSATCDVATKGALSLSYNLVKQSASKLAWKFSKGPELHAADFGDPRTSATTYALCVYDDGALIVDSRLPSHALNWKLKGDGYAFKDPNKYSWIGGIRTVKLAGGLAGKSKVQIKAAGQDFDVPPPPLGSTPLNATTSVRAQLHQNDGSCYETPFTPAQVKKNTYPSFTKIKFQAKY